MAFMHAWRSRLSEVPHGSGGGLMMGPTVCLRSVLLKYVHDVIPAVFKSGEFQVSMVSSSNF